METEELYDRYFDMPKQFTEYQSSSEHLSELFALLDMCLSVAAGAKGYSGGSFPPFLSTGVMKDLSVSSSDIGAVLVNEQKNNETIPEQIGDQIMLAAVHIIERLKRSRKNNNIPPFERIRILFDLDDMETFSLLLALSVEYDRKYEGVYAYLHNNNSDYYPTIWLAVRMYSMLSGTEASPARMLSGDSGFIRFLCTRELKKRDRTESSGRLVLSRRVAAYILGENRMDEKLKDFCSYPEEYESTEPLPLREELCEKTAAVFRENGFREKGCFVLKLNGPKGVGRGYMAYRAVSAFGLKLLRIDLHYLLRKKYQELSKLIDMIYTETVLTGSVPCFVLDADLFVTDEDGAEHLSDLAQKAAEAASMIAGLFGFVFWLTPEKDGSFDDTAAEQLAFELPMLTANERRLFWSRYLTDPDIDITACSSKYILTPRTIIRAAATAGEIAAAGKEKVSDRIVADAVRQHSTNQLGRLASQINAVFTWDDLVIGEDQKRKMKMICDQVRYRSVVNEDWGFNRKSPYGRGLCALFYGSPGTGKTMAVQVMANDLGLDLYRIDLSQLTSKYIGETQKNISELFDKAKNINAMLFFDEADSMFAKRSEVKDSNDRYANADTAFLLQKLEDHEGITILATNYVNNIDDAFKRRIKFMINFVFPDKDVRIKLWHTILPKSARVDEPLDLEFFAEHFELSGSNIKEILTNSAYLAASEGGGLRNRHIIEAVKLNYSKYGKILTNSDFGYLGR